MKPDDARTVYDGKLFQVTLERWGDNEREIVEHPGAVAIVAARNGVLIALLAVTVARVAGPVRSRRRAAAAPSTG